MKLEESCMDFGKLINIINYLIKVFVVLAIFIFIWFIGIKGTLSNPDTYDIRMFTNFIYLILLLLLIKFILIKSLKK